MNNIAKRHHYLPRSYLMGFAGTTRKLFVFDLELRRMIGLRSTRSIAYEPDWHTINWPGIAPDAFERGLGRFEEKVAKTIKGLPGTGRLTDQQLATLVSFLALTIARVPRFRHGMIALLEKESGLSIQQALGQPDNWGRIMKWLPTTDFGWDEEASQRFLRHFHSDLATQENYTLFVTLLAQDSFFRILSKKHWSLFVIDDDSGDFICSDNPFGAVPLFDCPDPNSISLDQDVVISFPLSRRLAIVGRFDVPGTQVRATRRMVATVNSQTKMWAWRYLYAPQNDFCCLADDGGICGVEEVFRQVVLPHPSQQCQERG